MHAYTHPDIIQKNWFYVIVAKMRLLQELSRWAQQPFHFNLMIISMAKNCSIEQNPPTILNIHSRNKCKMNWNISKFESLWMISIQSHTNKHNWCIFWLTKAKVWWLLKIVTSNFCIKLWRLSTRYDINSLFFALKSVSSAKISVMLTNHCLETLFWYDPFAQRGLVWMRKKSAISQLSLISWNHVSVCL